MSQAEGAFVVLEGIDGAGTTTQTARLAARLSADGRRAITTREPTAGPIGSLIRQALTHRLVVPGPAGPAAPSWQTMALLFAADRLDHLDAEILPQLRDGACVISDRYDLSSLAYQSAIADDDQAVSFIRAVNGHARRPDLTIVLHVSSTIAGERRRSRGGRAELYEHDELQTRLAEAYRQTDRLVPGDTVLHVDGGRPVDVVEADVHHAVASLLASRD